MGEYFISYSGAGAGTPNAHGLVLGQRHLLLDGGAGVDPSSMERPDWLWISHAHGDHCGGLMALIERWPTVTVLATEQTRRLLPVVLSEGQGVGAQVESICRRIEVLQPGRRRPLEESEGWGVTALRAGHCPGAAMLMVDKRVGGRCQGRVVYTGDFCTHDQSLVGGGGAPVARDDHGVDLLIMESILATDEAADGLYWEEEAAALVEAVDASSGPVLIGAMGVGEAQEVASLLKKEGRRRFLVDAYYEAIFERLGLAEGLVFGERRRMRDRLRGGGVVISSGPRFQRGSTSAYLSRELLGNERATILVLNRARGGTGAGRLLATGRGEEIQWPGYRGPLSATVKRCRLINHAPRWQLLGMMEAVAPKQTLLVHGPTGGRWAIKRAWESRGGAGEVKVVEEGVSCRLY